jgi:type IV secretory pathway VirB4 component
MRSQETRKDGTSFNKTRSCPKESDHLSQLASDGNRQAQAFRAGLNSLGRPAVNPLVLGPTGAGKTRVVEATAAVLYGPRDAFLLRARHS